MKQRWKRDLIKAGKLGLDTMVFIYEFGRHKKYFPVVHEIFKQLDRGALSAVTSLISYLEVISLKELESRQELVDGYREVFLRMPNLSTITPDIGIVEQAARLRRVYGLGTPDAVQMATAIAHQANVFVTNDQRLNRVKEIRVLLIKEMV